jgi:alanyl-tRNA synthetase
MKYVEIRKAFIDFFKNHDHQYVESSNLIPHNDPTLMFTNAGMNQFKDVFLGTDKRSYNRAVSIQKCLRAGGKHNDLENVGFTARHHTFFEMMGNFSFGDYFKKEAIHFAWEFLTKTLNIPENRLYVTVFTTDDEAALIWEKQIGVPKEKIFRYGEKDNFWRMGQTGPCGPCSEIFYDHAPHLPPVPLHEAEDRFVEIWNLVFMQFFEDESGKQTPLPKPSVDTGAGIERIAAAMQGFKDNYQCDIFKPLIEKTCALAKITSDWNELSKNPETLGAVKVIADHSRTAAFLISEGVLPSNEGKGYVLRRIMRRAIRYARKLNSDQSIFPLVCKEVISVMGTHYPLLKEKETFIVEAVKDEEKRFLQTLDKGSELLLKKITELKQNKIKIIDGELAFTLHGTYGFPFDLTEVIAKENQMTVDEKSFLSALDSDKKMARKARKNQSATSNEKHLGEWTQKVNAAQGPTAFLGYDTLSTDSKLLALSDGEKEVSTLKDKGWMIFAATPFYAEGGGQVADLGTLIDPSNQTVLGTITDCKKYNNNFIHFIELSDTEISVGGTYQLKVNNQERQSTANNHSATHLLNAALKKVLGSHVNQAGSLVNAQKLRFDFSHGKPVSDSELGAIEYLVNQQISKCFAVGQQIMSHKVAVAQGAVAMFGEKYADEVRVLSMGQTENGETFSKELCGGTHVLNTSEIRLFKILSETGVAAGVRRIEAITGDRAFDYLNQLSEENLMIRRQINENLPKIDDSIFIGEMPPRIQSMFYSNESLDEKSLGENLNDKVLKLQNEIQDLKKELKTQATQSISIDDILKESFATQIQGEAGFALMTRVSISDRGVLSDVADKIRDKKNNIVAVLIGESEDNSQIPLVVIVSKSLKKIHAGNLTKELCQIMGGKGGGRPDFAQGSVNSLDKLNLAKEKFNEFLKG